jgi:hypothetical protein
LPENSAGAHGAPGSGKSRAGSTARDRPGLQPGQRSIAGMMGPKTISRMITAPDGSRVQQKIEVVNFPTAPLVLTPKPTFPCTFGCGEVLSSLQGRIAHEGIRHHGRDGRSKTTGPIVNAMFLEHDNVPPNAVVSAVASLIELVELTADMSPEQREMVVRERTSQREAIAAADAARSEAAAKAARSAREAERAAAALERKEAGGGRRGEAKRHQHSIKEKLNHIEI